MGVSPVPNKSVVFADDQWGKDQIIATFSKAQIPYIGEHVLAICVDDRIIPLTTTGVVEQISHESSTCLVRPNSASAEESKVEDAKK